MTTTKTAPPHVRVKSYFAASIADAIELASAEMGPDALLLESRKAPPEARHLCGFEVVFGDSRDPSKPTARPSGQRSSAEPVAAAAPETGIDDLGRKVDDLRKLLLRFGVNAAAADRVVERTLIDAGIEAGLAAEIDDAVATRALKKGVRIISRPGRASEPNPNLLLEETLAELQERLTIKPEIGRVTALVGPAGAGKTTTLVKLAMREGVLKGRPVRIVSADWQRIAASEQLRIYAAILGVPFHCAENAASLQQIIDSSPANTLVLIDTPGVSPALMEGPTASLWDLLRSRQDIDIQVVLTATMNPRDLEAAGRRFGFLNPAALIFTRLDEAAGPSAVFSEALRSKTPVSFICGGQLIPEDIGAADPEKLSRELVRNLPSALCSAA